MAEGFEENASQMGRSLATSKSFDNKSVKMCRIMGDECHQIARTSGNDGSLNEVVN